MLRPRFKIQLSETPEQLLAAFEQAKASNKKYVIYSIDDHIFIKIPKERQHFWSPQLHLELSTNETPDIVLHGLFGPSPTV